jgi:hypothetical protein
MHKRKMVKPAVSILWAYSDLYNEKPDSREFIKFSHWEEIEEKKVEKVKTLANNREETNGWISFLRPPFFFFPATFYTSSFLKKVSASVVQERSLIMGLAASRIYCWMSILDSLQLSTHESR